MVTPTSVSTELDESVEPCNRVDTVNPKVAGFVSVSEATASVIVVADVDVVGVLLLSIEVAAELFEFVDFISRVSTDSLLSLRVFVVVGPSRSLDCDIEKADVIAFAVELVALAVELLVDDVDDSVCC